MDRMVQLAAQMGEALERHDVEAAEGLIAAQHDLIEADFQTQVQSPPGPVHVHHSDSRAEAESFENRARAHGARVIRRNW